MLAMVLLVWLRVLNLEDSKDFCVPNVLIITGQEKA